MVRRVGERRREVANYRNAYSSFTSLMFLLKRSGVESIPVDASLKLLNACRCASYDDSQAEKVADVLSEVVDGISVYTLKDGRLLGFSSPDVRNRKEGGTLVVEGGIDG